MDGWMPALMPLSFLFHHDDVFMFLFFTRKGYPKCDLPTRRPAASRSDLLPFQLLRLAAMYLIMPRCSVLSVCYKGLS